MESLLQCRVCGASLRNSSGRCANGCCLACHARYCDRAGHTLDAERARALNAARILANFRRVPVPPKEGPGNA